MKIRNGFVSNSSSSSFVLKLDKPIEEYTYEEFEEFMGYENPIKGIYNTLKDDSIVKDNNVYEIQLGNELCNRTSESENYIWDYDYTLKSKGIFISGKSHH